MTSSPIPSGDVRVTSATWSAQLNAFCTYGVAWGHEALSQSPKSPFGSWLKPTMLVAPPSIEKYRDPLDVRFRAPAADQLKRSWGRRSFHSSMLDPRPRTSSISCSTDRRASYTPAAPGRVKLNGWAELMVMIPSYAPP